MPQRSRSLAAAAALGAVLLAAAPGAVRAHPHVWIEVNTTLLADAAGHLHALRHAWIFDEEFTAFVLAEIGAEGVGQLSAAQSATVAEFAFAELANASFFSHARAEQAPLTFAEARDFRASLEDGLLRYDFTLDLPETLDLATTPFSLAVYEPSYYVELYWAPDQPLNLEAFPGCAFTFTEDEGEAIFYGMVVPPRLAVTCPGV